MNIEQIRARQLIVDFVIQMIELKEEPDSKIITAIHRAIIQAYTIGQEDLKRKAVKELRKLPGAKTPEYGMILSKEKRVLVADVLKIFDIVLPNSINKNVKTEQ